MLKGVGPTRGDALWQRHPGGRGNGQCGKENGLLNLEFCVIAGLYDSAYDRFERGARVAELTHPATLRTKRVRKILTPMKALDIFTEV